MVSIRVIRTRGRICSLEKGKIADLVVFADNPLENVYNTLHPRQVFQGGRLAFSA